MRNTGWKKLPFKDAVESHGSGSAGLPQKEWTSVGKFPVIGQGVEDIEGWTDRDDLLLTPHPAVVLYGGHTRRVKHVSHPFVPGPNVKILEPAAGLDSKFLYYFLSQLPIESRGYADHFPLVRKFDVPVPPLAEQQRIVRVLDEALEKIALAKANAEKNLQNARAVFEGNLQAVFTQGSDAWINKRLGEISHIQYGYTESSSITKVGPHFLRITDIQDNNVNWDAVPYCPIEAGEFRKFQLHDGDIVFARTGATTGKSYLVNDPPNSVFASYLIRVQLQGKELLPAFLNLYFQTQLYWDVIRAGVSGSAQGGFNATKLGELAIPFPQSIEMQQSLVDKLELLNGAVSSLEAVYERKNAALNALTSSLLERAFSGAMKAA